LLRAPGALDPRSIPFISFLEEDTMHRSLRRALVPGAVAALAFLPRAVLAAGEADPWGHLLQGVIGTVIFGLLGIVLAVLGQKVFEWTTPYSVRKELEEDQNTAVAIVMASMTLGISIIIAATILS
jgi:thiol:disulfide interchange protein